ncbi:hypothetical protein GF402_00660 [Candidatus Fermentibacteria bacterium]|nr:hypothetical protein [Candidatus Fermentibacteria bacterium]
MHRAGIVLLLVVLSTAGASERSALDLAAGAGIWVPGLASEDTELSVGPSVVLGLETPMGQSDCINVRTGYMTAGSDRPGYGGINAVPLSIGYRIFPLHRPFAGPRGLEPFMGLHGGGVLAWESTEDDVEATTTGGGLLGIELGARVLVSSGTFVDLTVSADYAPLGSALAGEEDSQMAWLKAVAALVF